MPKKKPEEIVQSILDFLSEHEWGSISDIAKYTSIDRRTASRYLKLLVKVSKTFPIYEVRRWSQTGPKVFSVSAVPLFLPARPSYFTFLPSPRMVSVTYKLCEIAADTGRVARGSQKAYRAASRKRAKLVVVAPSYNSVAASILLTKRDEEEPFVNVYRYPDNIPHLPPPIARLPALCSAREIPYTFVNDRVRLGRALGYDYGISACAIEDPGKGQELLDSTVQLSHDLEDRNPCEFNYYLMRRFFNVAPGSGGTKDVRVMFKGQLQELFDDVGTE